MPQFHPFIALLIAGFVFSLVNLIVKDLNDIPMVQIVFFRGLVSLFLCWIVLKRRKIQILPRMKNKTLWYRGVFGTVALYFVFSGVQSLPLAVSSTVQKLAPLFAAPLGAFWLKDKVEKHHYLALLIGFLGIGVLHQFSMNVALSGLLLALIGAVLSAVAYTCIRALKDEDPTVIIMFFPLVTTPLFLIPTIMSWEEPSYTQWIKLLAMGVLVQIAQIFLTSGYQRRAAGIVGTGLYIEVVFASFWGFIFFGEVFDLVSWIGILLILFAAFLSVFFQIKQK